MTLAGWGRRILPSASPGTHLYDLTGRMIAMTTNGHGGARTPANPAPVSGPSQFSQRTDGGPSQAARYVSGGSYGDGQALMDIQNAAPMAASGVAQTQGQLPPMRPTGPLPTPLGAPTQRPEEPVTEGNPLGPGSGPNVLSGGLPQPSAADAAVLKKYMPQLRAIAANPDSPAGFRAFVQHMNGQ
jgi:hypothetical protein